MREEFAKTGREKLLHKGRDLYLKRRPNAVGITISK